MSELEQPLLRSNGVPIPQYYNEETEQYEASKGTDGAVNMRPIGTTVEDYWEGSATETRSFTKSMYGFSIANDGLEELAFTINGITRRVYSGEPYNAVFSTPFTSVTVTATDKYRAEVLS